MSDSIVGVLEVNSVLSMLEDGWDFHMNNNKFVSQEAFTKFLEDRFFVVSITGPFNVGKGFLHNLLTSDNVPVGDTTHTAGLNFIVKEKNLFIDTEG